MNHFFLQTFFLLFISSVGHSQVAVQNKVLPTEYRPYEIKIKASDIKNYSRRYFKIIDNRADTTRLGFMKNTEKQLYFHFKNNPTQQLFSKINNPVQPHQDTLIVVLRKLWVFEREESRKNKVGEFIAGTLELKCYGRIQADVYSQRAFNEYVPLLKYDSSLSTNGYMANNVDYLLTKNLNILLRMSDSLSKIKDSVQATPTIASIQLTNHAELLPTAPLKDGIYLNLENFLKNEPIELAFDYKIKKKMEQLSLKELRSDDSIYSKYNWGFCKNGEPYIRIGSSFSKLTKIENSYELRGDDIARFYLHKGITTLDRIAVGVNIAFTLLDPAMLLTELLFAFLPDRSAGKYENISAFKLDIQTGEIY